MTVKHGVFVSGTIGEADELYWMGERVSVSDFNERLLNQSRSVAKDIDMIQLGADLHEHINEGEKAVAQMDVLQDVLKLLCPGCRALVGDNV